MSNNEKEKNKDFIFTVQTGCPVYFKVAVEHNKIIFTSHDKNTSVPIMCFTSIEDNEFIVTDYRKKEIVSMSCKDTADNPNKFTNDTKAQFWNWGPNNTDLFKYCGNHLRLEPKQFKSKFTTRQLMVIPYFHPSIKTVENIAEHTPIGFLLVSCKKDNSGISEMRLLLDCKAESITVPGPDPNKEYRSIHLNYTYYYKDLEPYTMPKKEKKNNSDSFIVATDDTSVYYKVAVINNDIIVTEHFEDTDHKKVLFSLADVADHYSVEFTFKEGQFTFSAYEEQECFNDDERFWVCEEYQRDKPYKQDVCDYCWDDMGISTPSETDNTRDCYLSAIPYFNPDVKTVEEAKNTVPEGFVIMCNKKHNPFSYLLYEFQAKLGPDGAFLSIKNHSNKINLVK